MIDKLNDKLTGTFTMEFVDKLTGEVVDVYEGKNIVLPYSYQSLLKCVGGARQNDYMIRIIKFGDDVGAGTLDNPEAPDSTYTIANQDVLFTQDGLDVFYETDKSVLFTITIDGNVFMDNFPTLTSKGITSATLCSGEGQVFSYKRFPEKMISRLFDININWKLEY